MDAAPAPPFSLLTHEAEDGTSTPMLLAWSRHASVRSLKRYARPGPEAVARRDDRLLGCTGYEVSHREHRDPALPGRDARRRQFG